MRYWLTTHWPNPADKDAEAPHSGVWLADGKIHAADALEPGDLVLVYETLGGKTKVERYADGNTKRFPRRGGRQGIVGLMKVLDRPSQPPDSQPEAYSDGTRTWWRYHAPTESLNSSGYVPREKVLRVLGLAAGYYFRGFGRLASGLGEISAEQFRELLALFEDSTDRKSRAIAARLATTARAGGGGEGPVHRALKMAIAANPSAMLGEEGLRLWQVEYVLPTNDRIDLVLVDRFDRFVVVEIEPTCDADEIIGPLQCAKYRALMSYLFERPLNEVRALLVAPTVHADVQERCTKHNIECREASTPSAAA